MPKDTTNGERTRKPRGKPKPYDRQPKEAPKKDKPRTSGRVIKPDRRENLTLADWLTVLEFWDKHKGTMSQTAVVNYFKSKKDGSLTFTQGALSRAIARHAELEARRDANPTALSSKRARVVTRPDVERALILWVRHMAESKGETVSGPMLREKRVRFEELLNVPDNQRLSGDGWVMSFCKTYKLKEQRRHGEAGSVDLQAVETERKRLQALMKKYAPRDRFNFDETGLFPK
jgi:hypothetical protein